MKSRNRVFQNQNSCQSGTWSATSGIMLLLKAKPASSRLQAKALVHNYSFHIGQMTLAAVLRQFKRVFVPHHCHKKIPKWQRSPWLGTPATLLETSTYNCSVQAEGTSRFFLPVGAKPQ